MPDGVIIREIALWTLTKHRDAVADHLDLSDEALQSLFERVEEEFSRYGLDVHDDDREEGR